MVDLMGMERLPDWNWDGNGWRRGARDATRADHGSLESKRKKKRIIMSGVSFHNRLSA